LALATTMAVLMGPRALAAFGDLDPGP